MLDDSQVRTYGEMLGVGVGFLALGDYEGVFFVVGGLGARGGLQGKINSKRYYQIKNNIKEEISNKQKGLFSKK